MRVKLSSIALLTFSPAYLSEDTSKMAFLSPVVVSSRKTADLRRATQSTRLSRAPQTVRPLRVCTRATVTAPRPDVNLDKSPSFASGDSDGSISQRIRPRRNRKTGVMRKTVRETSLSAANLVLPLFVHEGANDEAIKSMPGCQRLSESSVLSAVGSAAELGVGHVILFPKIAESLKSNMGDECYNPEGLVPRLVRAIKQAYPQMLVWTDIALDPYSEHGHDGVVSDDNRGDGGLARVLNDATVSQLCLQALCHARAGADVVAPSDMMDGRIGAIRDALDEHGFTDVSIVSYTAKYASAFYGPFRDALDSAPREDGNAPRDKKTYQMDPANIREAEREADLDVAEGADMLMVKPGLPYLDVIRFLREVTDVPIAAYQVSGEYAMIKGAVQNGWLDERQTVLESLMCFRRAGADAILTYYAMQAALWLKDEDQ